MESIIANEELKTKYNIVSPEIILIDKNMKTDEVKELTKKLEGVDGIDFAVSIADLKSVGMNTNMLSSEIVSYLESDKYQLVMLN